MRSEPDWKALPADTPAKIRDLVKRCLQKDPKRRLHDIADARLEIEEALAGPAEREPSAPLAAAAPAKKAAPIWITLGILAGALGGAILSRAWTPVARCESPAAVRSAIALPTDTRLRVATLRPSMAFSPDGRRLIFRAVKGRINQLYLRDLGRADAVPIPGTEGAFDPFFSSDGEWLAFFVGNELKKVALSGGAPTALSDAPPVSMGGTWVPDGSIIFAPRPNAGLARLPSGTKALKELTKLDANRGEHGHVWPQLLPDGENVLLVVRAGRDFDDIAASSVVIHSLKTGQHRVLVEGSAWARYVGSGYLLFTKGTTVFAATCDPRKWELTGPPAPLIHDVLTSTLDGAPYLAASDNGLLAWAGGGAVPTPSDTLLWVDRSGKEEALPLSDRRFFAPRLSPDGKRLAVVSRPADRPGNSVTIYDFARGVLSTLTPEPGRHFAPVWSPDGRRIAFSAFEAGDPVLAWRAADGSGPAELLTPGRNPEFPSSFSPDSRVLLYTAGTSDSLENMDLWLLSLEGKREHRPGWPGLRGSSRRSSHPTAARSPTCRTKRGETRCTRSPTPAPDPRSRSRPTGALNRPGRPTGGRSSTGPPTA
jgi:serine/threonine-protein kinase